MQGQLPSTAILDPTALEAKMGGGVTCVAGTNHPLAAAVIFCQGWLHAFECACVWL
jgi:hypothetical protein